MGWYKKVKFWPNERASLEDINNIQSFIFQYLGKGNQKFIGSSKYIVSGFDVTGTGGLAIESVVKDSVLLNLEGDVSGLEGMLWFGSGDDTIDTDLTATLTDNVTNYVEVELYQENSAPDTRVFWDMTDKAEFDKTVETCTNTKVRLYSIFS